MNIDKVKNSTLSYKGFFPTLREQPQERENPYALRDDLIKPLPPEGHLVHTNIFNAPKHMIDGFVYDMKALKKGIDGTANDHELGKLNNIGLVTGGAALATYLTTRKVTASSKIMEFVGIGSFLASMAIWPAVAIQLPTKLIHGFNVRQRYKDSMDREKMFFNDPQYIPWDLYSEQQIYKIGDYMGVPRDMNNRRDYIQNRMKQIATQDNTLWMLSAGFAVPIMSALICNQLEQPIKNLCGNIRSEQNKKILSKALDTPYDAEHSDVYKRLDSLLEMHKGQPVSRELVNQISELISYNANPMVNDKLQSDLKALLTSDKTVLEPQDGNKMISILRANLSKKFGKDTPVMKAIMPDLHELDSWLHEGGFIGRDLNKADFKNLNALIGKKILAKLEVYNTELPENERIAKESVLIALNNKINSKSAVSRFRVVRPALKLDENMQGVLRALAKELLTVDNKINVVKDYLLKELSSAEETKLANIWNKSQEDIFKALNIPWKDLNKARGNREMMNQVVRSAMDRIAADKTEFETVMGKLAEIAGRMDEFEGLLSDKGNVTFFEQTISRVLNPTARKLSEMGFEETAHALAGGKSNSEKSVLKAYARNRLMGVKSTLYRLINSLDMHRRLATLTNVNGLLGQGFCREVQEEVAELCKRNTLFAHRSDFAVKFYFNGNPHPNYADTSNIEVRNGKIVNKYYKAGRAGYQDVSSDAGMYKGSMRLMFEDQMHPQSDTILGSELAGKLKKYRQDLFSILGDEWYFIKPDAYMTEGKVLQAWDMKMHPDKPGPDNPNYIKPKYKRSPNKFKFLMTGVSLDDLAMKYASKKHNARAWMKLFGGLGIGIFALTVGAQFFFGKAPKPKERVK